MPSMLPGADLRQALQAGLWEALVDGSDRAAMRATCRDTRDMADELHDTAVLPVGPATWEDASNIAAYHRRLGAVRSVHVVYSGGAKDEARAVNCMEAYSAGLGATLPAAACSIFMARGRQLPPPVAAVLLQRVVPHMKRLDMALGSYHNLVQLLQVLEPCACLCSLGLLPAHAAEKPYDDGRDVEIYFRDYPGALGALCRLTRLHTLSGPWVIMMPDLQRLCDALPSLTTLGFRWLSLDDAPGACISRRLHTLVAWRHSAGHESLRLDRPWHLQDSTCGVGAPHSLQTALPALHHLDALVLRTFRPHTEDLAAIQAATQRFAAEQSRAEPWAWEIPDILSEDVQVLQGMLPGRFAALKHLVLEIRFRRNVAPADVASMFGSLVSAAPNLTTLALFCSLGISTEALTVIMEPLRRAARLYTIWLADSNGQSNAGRESALLEGVVRCLAQQGGEGGDEYCRALRHVLLRGVQADALAACRAALACDGICVSVDTCDIRDFF